MKKTISFLTMPNSYQFPENEGTSYTFYVDTAYVRFNTSMPQYMIALHPDIAAGDTIWCDDPSHTTLEDLLNCIHTKRYDRVVKAEYLYNAQDSVKNADYLGKEIYGALNKTRLAFVEGAHVGDTLYLLRGKNAGMTAEEVQHALSGGNYARFPKEDRIFLGNNDHKRYVFSFRLLDDVDKRFLIESVGNQIAPTTNNGGWLQNINGVMVIVQESNEAYGLAEIFDVVAGAEGTATSNDKVTATSVRVIASEGKVTILNASGKKVVINNILGQAVANKVLTSDNASITAPKGIVVVAVEGEEPVKAIVK
ncbi:MAG: DUF6383 domain-containing protein [Tannerellaceae bacterium]|nr:DUF6383 domain-containing protein [Tannerellaceae bacterium]